MQKLKFKVPRLDIEAKRLRLMIVRRPNLLKNIKEGKFIYLFPFLAAEFAPRLGPFCEKKTQLLKVKFH